jgi:tetratricopeptide (TPR) repeat protein
MFVAADRSGDAIAAVMKALPSIQGSASGEALAGDLYALAGARELARQRWEKAIALDPKNAVARLSLGRSLLEEARGVRAEIEQREEELDQRHPPKDLVALVRSLPDLWSRAEQQLLAAQSADPTSREAAEELVALYEERIGGLDPETATREEQQVLATYTPKLAAAKAALESLGGPR